MAQQTQSPFFTELPPELRNKVYYQYALDYCNNQDNDTAKKEPDSLLLVCRRLRNEAGAVMSRYASQAYCPVRHDPFTLTNVENTVGKPENVRTLIVHLTCDTTCRLNFLKKWRKSFFALAREINKLPESRMKNLRYIQIHLHPAPNDEICQGTLLNFMQVLEHPTLELIHIVGVPEDVKEGDAEEIRREEEREREFLINFCRVAALLQGVTFCPSETPRKKKEELLVEMKRYPTCSSMQADADRLTTTSDKLPPPTTSWFMDTVDLTGRSWGFHLVRERTQYLKGEAYHLAELERQERLAALRAEDFASDAATVGSSDSDSRPGSPRAMIPADDGISNTANNGASDNSSTLPFYDFNDEESELSYEIEDDYEDIYN